MENYFGSRFLAMMSSPVLAKGNQENASQYLPQVLHQGGITYTSGGYGLDERSALVSTKRDYNLIVSNAVKGGEFTDGETIAILNKNKQEVLTVKDVGPLFYAKLPAGSYVVAETNGNVKEERTVFIAEKKQVGVHFIWLN